jgi:hypothetical protein
MGKRVRILTVVGMALVAGAGIGASPAQATTSTGVAAASPSHAQVQPDRDRDWVAGYYRTRRACERAGWLGERFNHWDDYDCDRAYRGFRRGWWVLTVENDWRGRGHDRGHHGRDRDRDRDRHHDRGGRGRH